MKILPVAICLFAICAIASDSTAPTKSQSGRYRLLRAVITSRGADHQCVFKIDSATGRTWKYSEQASGNVLDMKFFEIEDINIRETSVIMPHQLTNPAVWLSWAADNPNGGVVSDENGNRVRIGAAGVSNILNELQVYTNHSHEAH